MDGNYAVLAWAVDLSSSLGDLQAWRATLWFVAAAALLGAFDISLPRGDSLGVTGALDVIALTVLGPAQALVVTVVGAVASYLLRLRMTHSTFLGPSVVARVMALFVALLALVAGRGLANGSPMSWALIGFAVSAFLLVELAVFQAICARHGGRSARRAIRGNIDRQAPLLVAQFSTAMLASVVFPTVGVWSLPLVVALLLLIRQSYSLLLEIRETFRTTVEVLVDAAEGNGEGTPHGHAERTAQIAREIAVSCALSPAEVERINYAALLHDIGEIAQDTPPGDVAGRSARVIEGVEFFSDVVEVVRLCDGDARRLDVLSEHDLLSAFIVALASDVDVSMQRQLPAVLPHNTVERLAEFVPASLKAKAVSAAIRLGYRIPAVA